MWWWALTRWWWHVWRPRWTYTILSTQSFASAEEAVAAMNLRLAAVGGEIIGIAASAMCCGGEQAGGAEWNVYALRRT